MRLRNVKDADDILNNSIYFIKSPETLKGKWESLFDNQNSLMVEVGMGKGDFLIGMAKEHPEWNFVGIEAYESVLARAIQKLDREKLDNLKVIRLDAKNIAEVFSMEIDTIYLNFSDPWPKTRHHKRRLTHEKFLKEYDKVFKDDSKIEMKTDDDGLFEDSLCYLSSYGYTLDRVSLDLWSTNIEDVRTEYETKFGGKGIKIKFLKAHKNAENKSMQSLQKMI